jgi:alkaline phosphatase D
MKHKWISALGILLALAFICLFLNQRPLEAESPSVTFTHGFASGDVTPSSAVLWTRIDQEVELTVEVSTDPTFQDMTFEQTVLATRDNDFTAQVVVSPLEPDQTYFYRWRTGDSTSDVGSFRTPPTSDKSTAVRFAYSGDSDGTQVDGVPFFNDFEVLDAALLEDLDFFVYLGDTIYSDSSLRATGPAVTLDEYRDTYKVNREIAALRNLMEATSVYAIWDDHEVHNDYDGQTVDLTLYANGRKAFLEYMPILALDLPNDPACAGDPLLRVFHWGKDVDIIILDERSCRSADAEATCEGDLAPTLPPVLRKLFGELGIPVAPSPPPGCLEALFDPSRTILGSLQKALFKIFLLLSSAKFKFVINEVPIQQFYALPYDRWEGYGAERAEILNFIRDHHIENVIFLTTDTHANLINEVFIDRFTNPRPIAHEFVTGPIARFTFEQEILEFVTDIGLDPDVALSAFHAVLNIVGVDCRHLDAVSYGLVDVDASAGTATITLKDDTGAVLIDQLNSTTPCTKTIGP